MAGSDITGLLQSWAEGDRSALDRMMPLVYAELHRLARVYLRRERGEHTLQPTALVNEAYLRLVAQHNAHWNNRSQFYGVAAQVMRRILVDHARQRQAAKRQAFTLAVSLDEAIAIGENDGAELLALDESLAALAEIDPDKAKLVELRYFAGLSVEEAARVLQVSTATVKRRWAMAKAWLYRDMTQRVES